MWSMNVRAGVPNTKALPIVRSFEAIPFPVYPYNGDIVLAFTGVSASSSIGTVTPNNSLTLPSIQNTASVGTLTPNPSISITGNVGTGASGTLTPNSTKALSGNASTVSTGTITVGVASGLTGNQGNESYWSAGRGKCWEFNLSTVEHDRIARTDSHCFRRSENSNGRLSGSFDHHKRISDYYSEQ